MNFSIGENEDGNVVVNHGIVCTKNDLFQLKLDEVVVRKHLNLFDEVQKTQEAVDGYGPRQASDGPLPLTKEKVVDLNHLGKLISRRWDILMHETHVGRCMRATILRVTRMNYWQN